MQFTEKDKAIGHALGVAFLLLQCSTVTEAFYKVLGLEVTTALINAVRARRNA